MSNQQETKF